MTDLEMIKLCAEAMGFETVQSTEGLGGTKLHYRDGTVSSWFEYDPLHDDAQAMALVKKLLKSVTKQANDGKWLAVEDFPESMSSADRVLLKFSKNADLNRAIVECVAKMEAK